MCVNVVICIFFHLCVCVLCVCVSDALFVWQAYLMKVKMMVKPSQSDPCYS